MVNARSDSIVTDRLKFDRANIAANQSEFLCLYQRRSNGNTKRAHEPRQHEAGKVFGAAKCLHPFKYYKTRETLICVVSSHQKKGGTPVTA